MFALGSGASAADEWLRARAFDSVGFFFALGQLRSLLPPRLCVFKVFMRLSKKARVNGGGNYDLLKVS